LIIVFPLPPKGGSISGNRVDYTQIPKISPPSGGMGGKRMEMKLLLKPVLIT